MLRFPLTAILLFASVLLPSAASRAEGKSAMSHAPAVGDKAPDFTLNDLAGQPISLTDQIKQGPTVLVVLRGYPGYQCPICTQQFAELMQNAKAFADANATVVFVYPGPAADLDKYAAEFVAGKQFPPNYRFLIDPDFKFTNLYHLRWNAPNETSYPSSFVIDNNGTIQFAKVSHDHGNRASAGDLVGALTKPKM